MKKINLAFLTLLISMIGCSGDDDKLILPLTPKEVVINAQAKVEGPLTDYMYVSNEKYNFEITRDSAKNRFDLKIDVKFIMYQSGDIKAGRGYNDYGPTLLMELLDKDGKPLLTSRAIRSKVAYKGLSTKISQGENKEEWIQFTGGIYPGGSYPTQEELTNESIEYIKEIQRISQFKIISSIEEERFESSSSENTENSTSSCDEFLDNYDEIMTKYIDAVKEYNKNPNDMTLLSKHTEILSEMSKWKTPPTNCADDPSFVAKFVEIQTKQAMSLSN